MNENDFTVSVDLGKEYLILISVNDNLCVIVWGDYCLEHLKLTYQQPIC